MGLRDLNWYTFDMSYTPKEEFMRAAIKEAIKAKNGGDYAIGAVIIKEDKIIASSTNRTKVDQDPTQHAELSVIREAAKVLGHRHLNNCILYTTHEPCPMCSAAAVWAKLKCVVVGARINDMADHRSRNSSNDWSWRTITISAKDVFASGDPKVEIVEDFMREECRALFH